jgi:hypothetical protein
LQPHRPLFDTNALIINYLRFDSLFQVNYLL